ncbi:hypothetical protein M758_10G046500 [Ceratodon purpureus]|nr:hypothetical protein M758_10G046500 [Ceratodon purpureus]
MSTFRSGSTSADEEERELARVLRRMQAVDKRFWEESKFLLLRNEVALQILLHGEASAQPKQEDAEYQIAEPMAVDTYYRDSETEEEERVKQQRFNSIVDAEVGHKVAVETPNGAINGQRKHYRTTQFHIHVLEDRVNKHRRDVESEMNRLQEEHVQLNNQLCRAETQFDELLREQQTYLTKIFKLYHRVLLNRESLRQDLEDFFQSTASKTHGDKCYVPNC